VTEPASDSTVSPSESRPEIRLERSTEDWSVLADPARRTRPFDGGKYIALSLGNPASYVSLGLDLRERWELVAAPNFATGGNRQDSYLLHRLQAHADTHLDANWRIVVQGEDVRAPGLIQHSDRSIQYACTDYQEVLQAAGITPSMSRRANALDNAPMESFFHTLKTELVHHRAYVTHEEARRDLFAYVESFYNRQRLHSGLGCRTPDEAERKAQNVA
jgi:hypothetical protein